MRFLLLLLALPAAAFAQADPNPTLLGAGVRSRPDFDGARKQTGDLIPVIRYYGNTLFARTTQGMLEGGARARLAQDFHVGAQVAYEGERLPGASVGLHAEWDTKVGPAPLTLLGRARQHVDAENGAGFDLRATLGVYASGPVQAGVFAQGTWATRKSMQKAYTAGDGGMLFASLGVLGSYDISRHWVLVGSAEGRRLSSEVARSALVERRSNYYASAGLAYRF
jgi:outer membrane scaffolding protein for murein synthesis (MipA/OmpV family)